MGANAVLANRTGRLTIKIMAINSMCPGKINARPKLKPVTAKTYQLADPISFVEHLHFSKYNFLNLTVMNFPLEYAVYNNYELAQLSFYSLFNNSFNLPD